jgi:hypothetical protein
MSTWTFYEWSADDDGCPYLFLNEEKWATDVVADLKVDQNDPRDLYLPEALEKGRAFIAPFYNPEFDEIAIVLNWTDRDLTSYWSIEEDEEQFYIDVLNADKIEMISLAVVNRVCGNIDDDMYDSARFP